MENLPTTTTPAQTSTGQEFEVLLIGGPANGRLMLVDNVQERYLIPQVSVEGNEVPGDLDTYTTAGYTTLTIPRSFSEGKPWFIAVLDGLNIDDAITLLFNNYVKTIHGS